MAEQLRSCRRTGCRWPAAASLSYRYASRQVWLLDLADESHPSLYDLCPHHADHLTLPRGWHLVDQRTCPPAIVEPAARDRAPVPIPRHLREPAGVESPARGLPEAAGTGVPRSSGVGAPGTPAWTGSRYAVLVEDLPRLAASLADHPDLQAHDVRWPSERPGPAAVVRSGRTHHRSEIDGQLAIPVDDLPALGSARAGAGREAVVVSIDRAGGRRRDPNHPRRPDL